MRFAQKNLKIGSSIHRQKFNLLSIWDKLATLLPGTINVKSGIPIDQLGAGLLRTARNARAQLRRTHISSHFGPLQSKLNKSAHRKPLRPLYISSPIAF